MLIEIIISQCTRVFQVARCFAPRKRQQFVTDQEDGMTKEDTVEACGEETKSDGCN